jgi:geranylgeranyl pyrophosphate synthase
MEQYYQIINTFIEKEYINYFPLELQEQILYLFSDGKKLRPLLCLSFINFTNNLANDKIILAICCTIELIHCISLVIDDLPEVDNDDVRRNKPAFHIKYGIEYTNFFIYYILNKANIILNDLVNNNSSNETDIELDMKYLKDIIYLFKFNLDNIVDGQYIDLQYSTIAIPENNLELYNVICDLIFMFIDEICINIDSTQEDILYQNIMLNIKKTGTLFTLATSVGQLLNLWTARINYIGNEVINYDIDDSSNCILEEDKKKYNSTKLIYDGNQHNFFNIVAIWGYILGYVFQISDDILDYNNDLTNNKPNICIIIGKDNTIKLFDVIYNWLKNTIGLINKNNIRLWDKYINIEVIDKILENIKNRIF